MPELEIRMQRQWPVMCPPCKMQMVSGILVPTLRGAIGKPKKRLITIELHSPRKLDKSTNNFLLEDAIATIRQTNSTESQPSGQKPSSPPLPIDRQQNQQPPYSPQHLLRRNTETTNNLSKHLKDEDRIVIRIMKPGKVAGLMRDPFDDDDDDDNEYDDQVDVDEYDKAVEEEVFDHTTPIKSKRSNGLGWIEFRRYDLDEIENVERKDTSWEATFGRGSNKERRELRFQTKQAVQDFQKELDDLQKLVKEHAAARLAAFQKTQEARTTRMKSAIAVAKQKRTTSRGMFGGNNGNMEDLSPDSRINLLVEIVSATDLPIADIISTDPYVIVFMGKQEVHRTKTIYNSLNPIWTVTSGSLFILSQTAEEFFSSVSGMTFFIRDQDEISINETVGKVEISQTDLLAMNGERIELDLQVLGPFKSKTRYFKPKLNVRVRPAKFPSDIDFLKRLHSVQNSKMLGIYADQSFVAPVVESTKLFKREKQVVDGVQLNRVKPRPDPSRDAAETAWMPKEQINKEALKPSTRWIAAGSGTLGKVFFEVIKCDNLPNMDSGVDGLSDPYCCIIYEDAIVNTDVINDELSPRWPPWSQRAFVFSIQHPSSQLLLGVVDYDPQLFDVGPKSHDCIGRITIDITNYAPDTEYLLTFDLHASVLDEVRPVVGTVTVRLRIEYESYRGFVMGSLALPPMNYINLAKKADFLTAYFVCCGEENLHTLDMAAIRSYRNELEGYLFKLLNYIGEATMNVVFWRGNYQMKVLGQTVLIPLHSAIAFTMATSLVENLNYFPSYLLFCIAWFFLATNEQRQRNPSPWHHSMTFQKMWCALISNRPGPARIAAYEDEAAVRKYEAEEKAKVDKLIGSKKAAEEHLNNLSDFLMKEEKAANSAIVESMETKVTGMSALHPFTPILLPIQKLLGMACVAARIVKSVLNWDESIFAFFIVNVCLAGGILLLWVPWTFLIRWTFRIVVWALLGPWMKFIDVVYIQKMNEGGDNKIKELNEMASKLMAVNTTRSAIMMQREDTVKSRDMKRYMFGKYITRCPQFKEYRYPDFPKPNSTAIPRKRHKNDPGVNIIEKKHGQRLEGQMVPTWCDAMHGKEEKSIKMTVSNR